MDIHHCIEKCAVGETYLLTTKHTKIAEIQEDLKLLSLHVLAARCNCSFKIVQVARWLPDSIVPFFPVKMYGELWRKNVPFFSF